MPEKLIIFASGTATGGGSGARKLIEHFANSRVAKIVGIVSNHADGGVAQLAKERGIPFLFVPNKDLTAEMYSKILIHFGAPRAWALCSGWLRFVHTKVEGKWGAILDRMDRNPGLAPSRTINIHPALLSKLNGRFGGKGKFGHYVHEDVKVALDAGLLDEKGERDGVPTVSAYSGFTMHFVYGYAGDSDYDRGPAFAEIRVPIQYGISAEQIGSTVNKIEHRWQSILTEMVVTGQIRLVDGIVIAPFGYGLLPKVPDPRWS